MADRISVVVADHDLESAKRLADALEDASPRISVAAVATSGTAAVERTVALAADALVTEFGMPDLDGFEITGRVAKDSPGTKVVWVTGAYSVDLVRRALGAGVAGVFQKGNSLSVRDLAAKIESEVDAFRAAVAEAAQRGPMAARGTGPLGRVLGRAAPERREVMGVGVRQRIVLIYCPKGGVGKTTVASNLAVVLKLSPLFQGLAIALLDYDTGWGNVAKVMDLYANPERTPVHRNLLNVRELDESRASRADVEDLMLRTRSGVDVLAAPPNPALARDVTEELAHKALSLIRRYYDIIIIDGGPKLPEAVNAAMEQATEILVVTLPEMQSVGNIMELRELLVGDGSDDFVHIWRKMHLVVNQYTGAPWELSLKEIQEATRLRIFGTLPHDPWVAGSLKHYTGKLAVETKPDSPFAVGMRRLAQDLFGAFPGAEKEVAADSGRRGLFGWVKPRAGVSR